MSADQSQHISYYIPCFWRLTFAGDTQHAERLIKWCQTWKFSFMRTGLKLLGMTTTPLCMLNLRATWAVVLLYFLAMDASSSSSNNGGHFRFTLEKWYEWNANFISARSYACKWFTHILEHRDFYYWMWSISLSYQDSSLDVPKGLYPTMTISFCRQNSSNFGWVK